MNGKNPFYSSFFSFIFRGIIETLFLTAIAVYFY